MKNKTIHLSSGKGPVECCWALAQLCLLIEKEAKSAAIQTVKLGAVTGKEKGTFHSITLELTGQGIDDFLQNWLGSILWICKSPFRPKHKRKNWFIAVFEVDSLKAPAFGISEVSYESFRASGPGGQHRNKVETAVRATHIPTGISVTSTDNKSQLQNKKDALFKLQAHFEQLTLDQKLAIKEQQWLQHGDLERGNPLRVFKGMKFQEQKR